MRPTTTVFAVNLLGIAAVCFLSGGGAALGVNWETMASHQLPAKTVVKMLRDNNIQKVKLFDADGSTMGALACLGIEVMVAIPNDQLKAMGSFDRAKDWVRRNVTRYNSVTSLCTRRFSG